MMYLKSCWLDISSMRLVYSLLLKLSFSKIRVTLTVRLTNRESLTRRLLYYSPRNIMFKFVNFTSVFIRNKNAAILITLINMINFIAKLGGNSD